jgi:hypothetical protein
MRTSRLGSLLSAVRQGIALEVGFGTRSLEALVWIAETVEEAVYATGSLCWDAGLLSFELTNPPLRVGAFRALRAVVGGREVPPGRLRVRRGPGVPWRSAASLSAETPLELVPGQVTEFVIDAPTAPEAARITVRLELDSVAIPPLVWLEFSDDVRRGRPS